MLLVAAVVAALAVIKVSRRADRASRLGREQARTTVAANPGARHG